MSTESKVIVHDAEPDQFRPQSIVQIHGCPYVITALEPSPLDPKRVEVIGQRLAA